MKNPAPIKNPTREFISEGRRMPGYSFFDLVHGLVYGFLGEHPLGKAAGKVWSAWRRVFPAKPVPETEKRVGFADTYHGKALPLGVAKQLVSVKQDLAISYPEQVIPYPLARELILHDPDHIIALDCPCRASRENPCQPVDVCLIVGEPFASMVARARDPGGGRGARARPSCVFQRRHAGAVLCHLQLLRLLLRRHESPAQRHPHAGFFRLSQPGGSGKMRSLRHLRGILPI